MPSQPSQRIPGQGWGSRGAPPRGTQSEVEATIENQIKTLQDALAFASEAALEPINTNIKELEAKKVECKPKDSQLVSINSKIGGTRKKLAAAEKELEAAEAAVKKANEAVQSARTKRVEVQESLADLESKQKQLASRIANAPLCQKTTTSTQLSIASRPSGLQEGTLHLSTPQSGRSSRRSHRLLLKCLGMLSRLC